MAKFCGKCGSKLDEATGLCPKCDAEKISYISQKEAEASLTGEKHSSSLQLGKKEQKKEKKASRKAAKRARKKAMRENMTTGGKVRRFFFKIFMIVLLLAVLAVGVIGTLVYFDIVNIPAVNDFLLLTGIKEDKALPGLEDLYDSEDVAPPDVEAYFEENSEIIKKISANDSDTIPDEAEVYKDLSERGFKDFPISTEYSMNGEYHEESEISDSSSSKHPVYYTYFITGRGDVWTIFVVNGAVTANPASYNMDSGNNIQTIVTESDTVMSYDSSTHMFYETIPKQSALRVKKVQRIDAETLEKLTF